MNLEQCARFRSDGARCINRTDNADGWCRDTDCAGFVRSRAEAAPASVGAYVGSPRQIATSPAPPLDLDVEEAYEVRISRRAKEAFRYHHAGGDAEAEAQLRAMLEDFLLSSARKVQTNGFYVLSREGFRLVLSPESDTVVGYSTVHRERTWEQVKAKVPSRISGRTHRPALRSKREPIDTAEFASVAAGGGLEVSARARRAYQKHSSAAGVSVGDDSGLDELLRRDVHLAVAALGSASTLTRREDDCFVLDDGQVLWLLAPDAALVLSLRRRPEAPAAQL